MGRSLFRDMKRSCCFSFLITSISLSKRNCCSKALATYAEWPLWNSLTEAFQEMAAPSTFSRGDQVCCWVCTSAKDYSSRLSTEVDLLSLGSLATFCCFVPFWRATSPSSSSCTSLFCFRFGMACSPRSVGGRGGGGGRVGGTWELGTSCEVDPFLAAIRSLRLLFPQFSIILSSSSSEEPSGQAITRVWVWTPECLSGSSSASEMWTI